MTTKMKNNIIPAVVLSPMTCLGPAHSAGITPKSREQMLHWPASSEELRHNHTRGYPKRRFARHTDILHSPADSDVSVSMSRCVTTPAIEHAALAQASICIPKRPESWVSQRC